MTATVEEILTLAASQIGTTDKPVHDVSYNTWFYGQEVSGEAYAWNDVFISWLGSQTDSRAVIGLFSRPSSHWNWFVTNKRSGDAPRPGAVVFFSFPGEAGDGPGVPNHVELVESVTAQGTLVTIGANTSADDSGSQTDGGGVWRRHRSLEHVLGFGYPEYRVPPAVTPKSVTVAGALGTALTALLAAGGGATASPATPVAPAPHKAPAAPSAAPTVAPSAAPTASPTPSGGTVAPSAPDTPPLGVPAPLSAVGARPASAHPELGIGASGRAVGLVQKAAGLPVTFNFDAATAKAVKSFQSRNGLAADGVVGPQTWPVVDAATSSSVLSYGATGAEVSLLQNTLGISASGTFDRSTMIAVEKFQAKNRLVVDGKVGPATRTALFH